MNREGADPRGPARAFEPPEAVDRPLVALRAAFVAVVLVVGLVAVLGVRARVLDDARDRQMALARRGGDLLADQVRELDATMSGASAVVRGDGTVSPTAIDAFGAGVVEVSLLAALAHVEVVAEVDRSAFEVRIGRPITDRVDGEVVPAPARDEHFAVVRVFPPDGPGGQLIGFDLAGDPVRAEAARTARDSGELVVSPPVPSQPTRRLAAFVTQAIHVPGAPLGTVEERRAATVGFLSSAFIIDDLFDTILAELPGGTRVSLSDGDELVAATPVAPSGAAEAVVPVQQRTWTLAVEDVRDPSWEVVWATGVLTVLLAAGLAVVLWRGARHEQVLARSYAGVRRTADLAQRLAASATTAAVAEAITVDAPPIFDASAACLRLVDRGEGAIVPAPRSPDDHGPDDAPVRTHVPLGARTPVADAVRLDELVLVRDVDRPAPPARPSAGQAMRGAVACAPLHDRPGTVTAILEIAWDRPDPFDRTTRATLTTVIELCEQALERARAAEALTRDAARAHQLAELGELVTTARTVADLTRAIVEHGARALGATATFLAILDGDGRRVHVHHDTAMDELLDARYTHQALDEPHVTTEAARTGVPVLVGDLDECARRFPAVVDDMALAGWASIAALPLLAFDGRVLGVLGVAWAVPTRFDDDVRPALTTAAELCAETLERTTITDTGARLAAALATLASELNASHTVAEVVGAATSHVAAAVDADEATVTVTVARPGSPPGVVVDAEARQALAARALVVVTTTDGPRGPGDVLDRAALPLLATDGRALGTLVIRWTHGSTLDDQLRARLRTIGAMCAQSIDRARRSDTEHRVIATLQRNVLSPIPRVDGVRAAARYVPASSDLGLGGDWYDGIPLDGGRIALVLGDVTGHGIDAVAEMALRRSAISTLLRAGVPLEDLLVRASLGFGVTADDTSLATVAVAVVDPAHDIVSYVTAGHPPPLLRSPDGSVAVLDDAAGPILGLPFTAVPVGRRPFGPGATLVLYSDGLVERRDEAIDVGIARLVQALGARGNGYDGNGGGEVDVEAMADRLFAITRPGTDDDVALAVVTRSRDA